METFKVLFFLLNVVLLSLAIGDWQHPHYSYRCLENGAVEIFGIHPDSQITVDGENDSNCRKSQNNTGVVSISRTCMNNTDKFHIAKIIVQDAAFDGQSKRKRRATTPGHHYNSANIPTPLPSTKSHTTTVLTPTPKRYFGGLGQHKFVITCMDIPDKGINKTVAHVFEEKVYNELPVNYKEVDIVEMRFKAVNDSDAPDISSVYIGDEFYMFIKYMGQEEYTVIPEECAAYGEAWIPKGYETTPAMNWVELWNIHNYQSNSTGCANHKELLEEFGKYNKTLIYAKMYGFRFANKNYVTITCQVRIFNSQNPVNALCTNLTQLTGRRKRNIENVPFQRKTLTKKLRVLDNKNVELDGNNGLQIKWETSLWIMIFATITFNFWLADY